MPVLAQSVRTRVRVAAVSSPVMNQAQRRLRRITPVNIMQTKPLREIDPRGRAGAVEVHAECPVFFIRRDAKLMPGQCNAKTPVRSVASGGGHCCEAVLRALGTLRPSSVLSFQLACP